MNDENTLVWSCFAQTILEFHGLGIRIDLGSPVTAEARSELVAWLGTPITCFCVLTADNPDGRDCAPSQNDEFRSSLFTQLSQLGVELTACDGTSPDGRHREVGWAVRTDDRTGWQLAQQFHQLAFFYYDGARFWLVSTATKDGVDPDERPACEQSMSELIQSDRIPLPVTETPETRL